MLRLKPIIFLTVAISGLGMSVILPILAPLIRELGLSESQGGWMVSIGSVIMAATGVLWGSLSDKWGRKTVLLIGFAGLFVAFVIYTGVVGFGLNGALTGSILFAALLIGRGIVGAFLVAVPSAAQALMADNTTAEQRSSGMSVISAAQGVGMVFGPALGGILALKGLIWPLVMTTILCAAGFVLAAMALPKTPAAAGHKSSERINPFKGGLWLWLFVALVTFISIITMQISAGFYIQDKLELSNAETGPVLAVAFTLVGLALIFAPILQVRLLRWPSRVMVLCGALLWIAAIALFLSRADVTSFYTSFVIAGVGAGLLMPGYNSGASLSVGTGLQGAVAGLIAMMHGHRRNHRPHRVDVIV